MSKEDLILKRLDRLDVKLNKLNKKEEQHWVTAYVVYEATGWDAKKLLVMKKQGVIKWDETKKRYLLESIPALFLKNQSIQST